MLTFALHSYLAFIAFNAAIIFARGSVRYAALAFVVIVLLFGSRARFPS